MKSDIKETTELDKKFTFTRADLNPIDTDKVTIYNTKECGLCVMPITVPNKAHNGEVTNIFDWDSMDIDKCRENYSLAAKMCMAYNLRLVLEDNIFITIHSKTQKRNSK